MVWDREKFNNASIDEIRKDFRRELLIPEMGDDEIESGAVFPFAATTSWLPRW
jgi:hypothetical protein